MGALLQTLAVDRLRPAVFRWKRDGPSDDVSGRDGLDASRSWSRQEAEARIPHLGEFHQALEGFSASRQVGPLSSFEVSCHLLKTTQIKSHLVHCL